MKFGINRNSVYFLSPVLPYLFLHFILCIFFLEGEKKKERKSNGDKKCTEFRFIEIGVSAADLISEQSLKLGDLQLEEHNNFSSSEDFNISTRVWITV